MVSIMRPCLAGFLSALPVLLLAACAHDNETSIAAPATPHDPDKVRSESDFGFDRWRWYVDPDRGMAGAGIQADGGRSLLALECVIRGDLKLLYVAVWTRPRETEDVGRALVLSFDGEAGTTQAADSRPEGFDILPMEPGYLGVLQSLRTRRTVTAVTMKGGKEIRRQQFALDGAAPAMAHVEEACGA